MGRLLFTSLLLFCLLWAVDLRADQRSTVLIRLPLSDESVTIVVEKSLYHPGDTILISIIRSEGQEAVVIIPVLNIEGAILTSSDNNSFTAQIPHFVTPGTYPVHLSVRDSVGRRLMYETDCQVTVEEYQEVEQIERFAQIIPESGGSEAKSAVTLDRANLRSLMVYFQRDSIREGMGPQFVTIRTKIWLSTGKVGQTLERRVLTFRSRGNSEKDRALFVQYRTAYGPYAAIRVEECDSVHVELDTLPNWAVVEVSIEPDYTIKIGATDRRNAVKRFFRVKGRKFQVGLVLGIPKVLYDTRAKDSIEYGHTSAMLRVYYVDGSSGHRFPFNIGVGTFGVNSPIDVSVRRGGFAASVLLDLVELMRRFDLNIGTKVNVGLEVTPFFPVQKKSRVLFDAHVGLAL